MKRFAFPLEKLRSWRRSQFEMEEAKLESLIAQRSAVDRQRRSLLDQQTMERQAVCETANIASADLAALARWLSFAGREQERLDADRRRLDERIASQRGVVMEAKRNLEVLNQFRSQQHARWRAEIDAEQEQMVAELVVSRWKAKAGTC
jgi:hypothetical protein